MLLHEFFEISAARFGERVAVEVPRGPSRPQRVEITYGELNARAGELCQTLRRFARPDAIIPILLPRDSYWIYAAQLAVLQSGAAFTCLDPAQPDTHLQAILDDIAPAVLITDARGRVRCQCAGLRADRVLDVHTASQDHDSPAITPDVTRPDHLAYVIYTSGTTGAPKGVMIEHRSVTHLVAADVDEFGLGPLDRVAQGSSLAYDSSIEEIWLAFAAGATLVVMDDETSRLGPDLVGWLQQQRISVFCPPPTLLRTTGCADPRRELPELRLLYVGGEALPQELADRWAPGRRLVNGYGPTECTITVVRGDVIAGQPVTIGCPVRGHTAYVLDAHLAPVLDGEPGELCLAGPGLARGYYNQPAATLAKFPVHDRLGRIYRTGDLVRWTTTGQLEYLGRIDSQVKLRGHRIELEAVEEQLARLPGVREAACRVQQAAEGQVLAAHIVADPSQQPPNFATLKAALSAALPPPCVPSRFGLLTHMPRTVGGKLDRRALPDLPADAGFVSRQSIVPRSPAEDAICLAFRTALNLSRPVSPEDDFFQDLGGDSISAVAAIRQLRQGDPTSVVTTRDLYLARTPRNLAKVTGTGAHKHAALSPPPFRQKHGAPYPALVTAFQALWLTLGLVAVSAIAYTVIFLLLPRLLTAAGVLATIASLPLLGLGATVVYSVTAILVTAALKWTLIGRYDRTVTPVWSWYYLRHWIVAQSASTIPWGLLAGTATYGAVLRMLGARVGRRVHIHRGVDLSRGGWDLLTLGDDVSLGCDCWLGLVQLDRGCLCISAVTIGDGGTVETRAGLSGGAQIEPDGVLTALSWLPADGTIPRGQRWDGVPAKPAGESPRAPERQYGQRLSPVIHDALLLGSALAMAAGEMVPLMTVLFVVALGQGLGPAAIVSWLNDPTWHQPWWWLVALVPLVAIPCGLGFQALCTRALGTVPLGVMERWSVGYIRIWHKVRAVESAGRWLSGTLFWPSWLRLAGMRVGCGCEISTILDVIPESIVVGDECFFADGVYLGGPRIHRGTVTVAETRIGSGTFVGNHAVIPAGTQLATGSFLGVCTVARDTRSAELAWFGHPAMPLARREVTAADRRLTHDPDWLRQATRVFWETMRLGLPGFPLLMLAGWLEGISRFSGRGPGLSWLAVVALASFGVASASCLSVFLLKWLLLGRVRAGQHPLWSCWCSRWDFVYVAWQFYARGPLSQLQGTLLLNVLLRASGAKIGRRVVLGPGFAQLVDPDMLCIADEATVNANFQAHSFEDRILKIAPLVVRRRATVGEEAVIFYGADIGDEAYIAPHGVVMKHEHLEPGTLYAGCPVSPLARASSAPLLGGSRPSVSGGLQREVEQVAVDRPRDTMRTVS